MVHAGTKVDSVLFLFLDGVGLGADDPAHNPFAVADLPNLIDLPAGCRFAPRCLVRVEENVEQAWESHPELRPIAPGHDVRCWLYHDAEGNLLPRAGAPTA